MSDSGDGFDALPSHQVAAHITPRVRLKELVSQLDPGVDMEASLEDLMLETADEFVESVTAFAARIAAHRGSPVVEAIDVALALDRAWGMKIPGYTLGEEIRPPRRPTPQEGHTRRLAAVVSAQKASAKEAAKAKEGSNNN